MSARRRRAPGRGIRKRVSAATDLRWKNKTGAAGARPSDGRRTRSGAPPEAPGRRGPGRHPGGSVIAVEGRIDDSGVRRSGARAGAGAARVCRGLVERGAVRRGGAEFMAAGVMVMVVSMPLRLRGEGGERIDNLRAAQIARTPMERGAAGQRRGHVALGNDGADEAIAQQGQQGRKPLSRRAQAQQTPGAITAAALIAGTQRFSQRFLHGF